MIRDTLKEEPSAAIRITKKSGILFTTNIGVSITTIVALIWFFATIKKDVELNAAQIQMVEHKCMMAEQCNAQRDISMTELKMAIRAITENLVEMKDDIKDIKRGSCGRVK